MLVAALVAALIVFFPLAATARVAAIELEPRVEAVLDARAVRRLIQLELSEVQVPPPVGQSEAALFVRVLSAGEGQLRVELWERGEQHGTRFVSGTRGSPSVIARRVALVAAELARGLMNKRLAEATRAERAARRAAREERLRATRTLDGPQAVRPGVEGTLIEHLWLAGPTLDVQVHAFGRLRIDAGAAWSFGLLTPGRTTVEALSVRAGPSRRFVLGSSTDLDIGLRAEAALLSFQGVASVDGLPGERASYWARAMLALRFERRLSRELRLDIGLLGGYTLRRVPLVLADGRALRLGGGVVGAELGIVMTPPSARAAAGGR